jgi:MATE family multidrug resistance protein
MYVADRIILAHYSLDSMNAAGLSGNFFAAFLFMFIGVACTAEVYVGQYNGSGQPDNLAVPVWQMIYMSLIASVFFIPVGYFSESINLLPKCYKEEGVIYQSMLCYFGSLPCIVAALSAFFIGQGKTAVVTSVVFIGNILNVGLDILFVFGFKGICGPLGTKGAAIGTIISAFAQVIILFTVFLKKTNRIRFKTLEKWHFNKEIFCGCCRIGIPMSIGSLFEISAWYLLYAMVGHISKEVVTVYSISGSIFTMFVFVRVGLSKSIATLSANLLGARDLATIRKLLKLFMCLATGLIIMMAIPFILYPSLVIKLFGIGGTDLSEFYIIIKEMMVYIFLDILLEILAGIVWGVLLSGGDTRYPVIANMTSLWGLVMFPMIIMYNKSALTSDVVIKDFVPYKLIIVWSIASLALLYRRYRSMKWCNKIV